MRYDYKTFWRTVTNDGKMPCALAGSLCHRCKGNGEITFNPGWPDPRTEDTKTCSLCRGLGSVPCSGVVDAHHYVPKRIIKLKLGGEKNPRCIAALLDVRNGICLCREHHDLVEGLQVESPVPQMLSFFCAEHELELPEAARARATAAGSHVPDEMISLNTEKQLRLEDR